MQYFLILYLAFCPMCKKSYTKELKSKNVLTFDANVEFVECPICKKLNLGSVRKISSVIDEKTTVIYEVE